MPLPIYDIQITCKKGKKSRAEQEKNIIDRIRKLISDISIHTRNFIHGVLHIRLVSSISQRQFEKIKDTLCKHFANVTDVTCTPAKA